MMWRKLSPFVMGVALLLAGCSGAAGLDRDAADALRATAYSVAELSSEGDAAGALVALGELEQDLRGAEADGAVSAEKARSIQELIDLVRADLQPVEPVTTELLPPTLPASSPEVVTEEPSAPAPDGTVDTGTIDSGSGAGTDETSTGESTDNGNPGNGGGNGKGNGGNGKGNGR